MGKMLYFVNNLSNMKCLAKKHKKKKKENNLLCVIEFANFSEATAAAKYVEYNNLINRAALIRFTRLSGLNIS